MIAVVTAPFARHEMERERDVAARALGNEPAGAALGVVRMPAPVEEQQRLLALLQTLLERGGERQRKHRIARRLATQIDDAHRGQ